MIRTRKLMVRRLRCSCLAIIALLAVPAVSARENVSFTQAQSDAGQVLYRESC